MFTRTLSRKLEGRPGLRRTAAREASSSMCDLHQIDFDEILSKSAKCVQHIAKGKMYQIVIKVLDWWELSSINFLLFYLLGDKKVWRCPAR